MAQRSSPSSVVSGGTGWSAVAGVGGANLWNVVDEYGPFDDVDYARSPTLTGIGTTSDVLYGVPNMTDPLIDTGFSLYLRHRKTFISGDNTRLAGMWVELWQGGSYKWGSDTDSGGLSSASFADISVTVPTGVISGLTVTSGQFQNLQIRLVATTLSSGADWVLEASALGFLGPDAGFIHIVPNASGRGFTNALNNSGTYVKRVDGGFRVYSGLEVAGALVVSPDGRGFKEHA